MFCKIRDELRNYDDNREANIKRPMSRWVKRPEDGILLLFTDVEKNICFISQQARIN